MFTRQYLNLPVITSNDALNEYYDSIRKGYGEDETNPKDIQGNKKPQLSLVPPSVMIHLAEAFKEGASKYGAYNWRTQKVQSMIYLDAALRHIMAVIDGEDIDPESNKHHLDGALASLAIYIDAMETGNLIDTRPTKGVAGKLIRTKSGK